MSAKHANVMLTINIANMCLDTTGNILAQVSKQMFALLDAVNLTGNNEQAEDFRLFCFDGFFISLDHIFHE